jgi:hypothetical protein
LDGGKLYIEILYLDEFYDFIVQIGSIWIYFDAQIIDTIFRFKIQILDLDSTRLFEPQDDFKWKKFELKSCRSQWKIQFLYKVYPHPSL